MPDLSFTVLGATAVVHGLSPMLKFQVRVRTAAGTEKIQALLLQSQIHFQPAQRVYSPLEKEKLTEIFGPPAEWARTLRNRLWAHASTTASGFIGETEIGLFVPCTYDLDQAAAKYFFALEGDEVSLLFLFNGSVFYQAEDGALQVQPISWDQECEYRMPVRVWQEALDAHFPNSAWMILRRDVFSRLADRRRALGATSWEQTIEALLQRTRSEEGQAHSIAGEEVSKSGVRLPETRLEVPA